MKLAAAGTLTAIIFMLSSCLNADLPEAAEPVEVAEQTGTIAAVVDGDTIDVLTETGKERVRIIGIDTPEIDRSGGTDDCYAQEARDLLNDLTFQQHVELTSDPTQADRDRYDRLLRHVSVDGHNCEIQR